MHGSVSSAAILGVVDSMSVRWRVFAGAVCVCSFYAHHAGIGEVTSPVLAGVGGRCQTGPHVAGDANVWHPHFHLGRARSVDNLIVPFVVSCDLVLCNPADRPTHNAGAALDLVFVSSIRPATEHGI